MTKIILNDANIERQLLSLRHKTNARNTPHLVAKLNDSLVMENIHDEA